MIVCFIGVQQKNHDECNACKAKKADGNKVLRYFPLIPRLRRLYSCPKIAKDMRWHDTDHTKDGKLRHLADALAWKAFDAQYPKFATDP